MPSTCSICTNTITRGVDKNIIVCSTCNHVFHMNCANVVPELYDTIKSIWKCNSCDKNCDDINAKSILEKFEKFQVDLCSVKNTIGNLEKSFDAVKEVTILVNKQQTEIKSLKSEVTSLRAGMNRLETLSRMNNIVVTGVPETPNENILGLLEKLGQHIRAPIKKEDISKFCRFRSKTSANKPILVVLKSYDTKQLVLYQSKKAKVISGSAIGFGSDVKIRMGDHLTPFVQRLLHTARKKLVDSGKLKFVWVQNGEVLAKKNDGGQIFKIKKVEDIDLVAAKI